MDPVAALERIAYYLDRSLAEGHRVSAYLKAAEVVRSLAPGEVERRAAARTLTELPSIGPKTATVITQALDGHVPYLEELEAATVIEAAEGAELRAALRGDCHLHSTWSDGGAPIATMVETARSLGHDYLVVTDHSARLTVAHGLSRERLLAQLDEIERLRESFDDFTILTGMEVDILADGGLDLDDELLGRLDVVVGSVHSKLSMPAPDMTRRMVMAIANPNVDILGHCTGRKIPGRERPIGQSDFSGRKGSEFDAEIVFAACAQFDKAVEINCRPERMDPPDDLLALALEWDCKLSIDTDAHAPGQLEWQAFGCDKAARAGVDAERVVNTWDAGELVAWAASHDTTA